MVHFLMHAARARPPLTPQNQSRADPAVNRVYLELQSPLVDSRATPMANSISSASSSPAASTSSFSFLRWISLSRSGALLSTPPHARSHRSSAEPHGSSLANFRLPNCSARHWPTSGRCQRPATPPLGARCREGHKRARRTTRHAA